MVSIRCGGAFVFVIIFMLLHFVAYSLQDTEKIVSAGDRFEGRTTLLSRPEKDGLKVVPKQVAVTMNVKIIGGRKTMKIVHEEHINGEEMASKKASSSSSNPRNGNHKVVAKRQKKIYHHDDHEHHVEVKMRSTFMALNADYHVPRSHPPRNN